MKVKKFIDNKIVFLNSKIGISLILILLVFVWVIGALLFNNKLSFSVLNYGYDNKLSEELTLVKGKTISDEFKAKDNFLGIVFIKFNDFAKPNYNGEDVLQFRIKEKGEKDWYYINNYRSGLLKDSLTFPFGFPVIRESKNRNYVYEVESLNGNTVNAVGIQKSKPFLSSGHQYSQQEAFGSKKRIFNFFIIKAYTSFTNLDFILSSLIFALPLIFYLLWLLVISKTKFKKSLFLTATTVVIFLDIFLIKSMYLGLTLILIASWIICIKNNKLESSVSFLNGFIAIIIWIFMTFIGIQDYSVKLNLWAYTFLFIGAFQALIEVRYNIKRLVGYKEYLKLFKFYK